jgi:hypothetical protein
VVSGLNTNALEPVYHQAAKALLDRAATNPAAVFQHLKPIYVDDVKFEQDFARFVIDTSGQRKKLAKYILGRIEADASHRAVDPDTDPGTIEHILPENPVDAWDASFPRDRWESAVYRLGNLTLLEPVANRRVGNAEYAPKSLEYGRSTYAITRAIPELAPEEWTPPLLDERQKQLASRAVHVWRSDFP